MSDDAHDLLQDPTAKTAWHRLDDRFVPLRPGDLIAALLDDAQRFGIERSTLSLFYDALCARVYRQSHQLQLEADELYANFNPDRDTQPICNLAARRTSQSYAELHAKLEFLLNKANFEKLTGVEIERVINAATSHGFRVRLNASRIESLEVWVRGRGTIERVFRDWRNPIKGKPRTLHVFRRLVVVARLKADPHVLVKMFKDIPEDDVEALLPHAEVQMNFYDRLMLVGSGAGALIPTALKLLSLAAALTQLLWALLVGAGTLIVRTVLGYRRAYLNRDWQRTRHLYFQNLSNNVATIQTLVAMIAQEEIKETLLAYVFCVGTYASKINTPEELEAAARAYLLEKFGAEVDFDVHDAIAKLSRLGLWSDRARLNALEPAMALLRLGNLSAVDVFSDSTLPASPDEDLNMESVAV